MSRKELYRRTKGCVFHGIADFVVWIILTLATAAIGITENPAQIQIILAFLLLSDLVASVVLFLAYWKYWLDLIQKATLVFSGEVVSGGPIIGAPIETRTNWRLTEKGTDTMRQFLIYLPEMEKQYHKTTKTTLIQDMFMSLYADKAKGILTEQRFLRMTETLEQEQADNKVRMQTITNELHIASSADSDVCRFIGEIREYASITELDETILNRLIDKIYISAVEVIDGEKVQKVRIIYNFVGEIAK